MDKATPEAQVVILQGLMLLEAAAVELEALEETELELEMELEALESHLLSLAPLSLGRRVETSPQ